MPGFVVFVTGVPGSGKSTLARQVAATVAMPLLSLDVIKESLFATLGVRDREWALHLRDAATDVIWSLLRDCPTGAVVDIWLDPTRDQSIVRDGLDRLGLDAAYEILCEVPGEVAAQRYAARDRHPGHLPGDDATLNRIRSAAQVMAPLGIGPALRVDTTREVDVDAVVRWLRERTGAVD